MPSPQKVAHPIKTPKSADKPIQITPATSPKTLSIKEQTIDFPDAMREVINGKKVTKLEWGDRNIVVYLNGRLRIDLEDGTHDLLVTQGDMIGTDWVIVAD